MIYQMMRAIVRDPVAVHRDVVALWHQLKYPDYDIDRLQARYQQAAHAGDDPLGPALMYWVVRHTRSGKFYRPSSKFTCPKELPFLELAEALGSTPMTNLDFKEAFKRYDAPGRTFLVDPPWPNDKVFEYSMAGRHAEMFRLLFTGQSDFVVAIQSSGGTISALAQAGFHDPPRDLFCYRRWCAHSMELIIASFALDAPGVHPYVVPRF